METISNLIFLCVYFSCLSQTSGKINRDKYFKRDMLAELCSNFIVDFGKKSLGPKDLVHFFVPRQDEDVKMFQIIEAAVVKVSEQWVIHTQHTSACLSSESWLLFPINKNIHINYFASIYIIPAFMEVNSFHCRDAQLANMYKQEAYNPEATFILIRLTDICGKPDPNTFEIMNTFDTLWAMNVITVLLVILSECDLKISVITGNPFSDRNPCRVVEYGGLDVHQPVTNLTNVTHNFQKERLSDFRGCDFKVETIPSPPYVIGEPYTKLNETHYDFVGGIEIELIRLLSARVNFSIDFYKPLSYDLNAFLRKLDNGTFVGIYEDLVQHKIDVAFAGIIPTHRNYYKFDYSNTYKVSTISCFVSDANQVHHLKVFFLGFHAGVWVLSGIIFMLVSVMYSALDENTSLSGFSLDDILKDIRLDDFFRLHLGFSSTLCPKSYSLRVLLVFWAIYGLNWSIGYTTVLYILQTKIPLQKEILSFKDLRESGLRVNISPMILEFFNHSDIDKETRSILDNYKECYNPKECFTQLITYRNVAVIDKFETIEYQINLQKARIHQLNQNILTYPVSIITNKGNPLSVELNRLLALSFQAGLMEKWELEASWYYHKIHDEYDVESDHKWHPLGVKDFAGVFVICMYGFGISFVALLAEILIDCYFNQSDKVIYL